MRQVIEGYLGFRLLLALHGDRALVAAILAAALILAASAASRLAGF
jgi:hypothetical protein